MAAESISQAAKEALKRAGLSHDSGLTVTRLAGDGSDRCFYRCRLADGQTRLAVLPGAATPKALAEAAAAHALGRHFQAAGVPAPAIYGFDPASGALLMEDLGDSLLHHQLAGKGGEEGRHAGSADLAALVGFYRQAIDALLSLQIDARPGFPVNVCWDTPRYDRQLMLARESGYFYQALARDLLGLPVMPADLAVEFEDLADLAAAEPADFVLHRDYQCRNLMLKEGRVRIIDFQGARLGPLAYDLASLLDDPYAALPQAMRDELFAYYLAEAARRLPGFDPVAFGRGFYYLALQRNLQIMGAFAFLSEQKKKEFFRPYIRPAARKLAARLGTSEQGRRFPRLTALAEQVVNLIG